MKNKFMGYSNKGCKYYRWNIDPLVKRLFPDIDEYETTKAYCLRKGLNYGSIRVKLTRLRKKERIS